MGAEMCTMFRALGDPTRFKIFDFLRSRCCKVAVKESGEVHPVTGPTVGEVCCHVTGLEKTSSAISFHLKELRNAGLITMEKRGKYMICGVNRCALESMAGYLGENPAEVCA